jgi:hypothetical protein
MKTFLYSNNESKHLSISRDNTLALGEEDYLNFKMNHCRKGKGFDYE